MAFRLGAFAAENAPLLEDEAMIAARLLSRAGRGAARFGRAGYRAAARMAGKAYRVGKANPFTAGMLAQSAISKLGKKKKRKLSRPAPGPVKRPKGSFRATPGVHATFGTSFRKGTRPKRNDRFVKHHFEDYGIINRNHCAWFGFQTHGSNERICFAYAQSVLRAILAKMHIYPRSFDEVLVPDQASTDDEQYETMRFDFIGINDSTGVEDVDTVAVDIRGKTFEEMVVALRGSIETQLQSGRFMAECRVFKMRGGALQIIHDIKNLQYGKLKIYVKQIVRLQNLSPNDAGTSAIDVTGTNPIQGKIYDFTTQPLVNANLVQTHPLLDDLQQHSDSIVGHYILPQNALTNSDGILGHPPPAGSLFRNCRRVSNVRIDAGANKFKVTQYKFEGTLVDFLKRFAYGNKERALGGGISWFAFEQAFRSGQDAIKIAFNRELHMSSRFEFNRSKTMLRHYDQTDLGDLL